LASGIAIKVTPFATGLTRKNGTYRPRTGDVGLWISRMTSVYKEVAAIVPDIAGRESGERSPKTVNFLTSGSSPSNCTRIRSPAFRAWYRSSSIADPSISLKTLMTLICLFTQIGAWSFNEAGWQGCADRLIDRLCAIFDRSSRAVGSGVIG